MAYQEVGTGASANDGTGDDLRTGAGKINANIVELYAKVNGVATSAISDGTAITTDTVALLTATQTLTNKTLTSPTLNTATVGTSLDMDGGELFLDADADTSITADTDDTIHFKIAGNDRITMSTGLIDLKNDGTQSEIRMYCESSNVHYAAIQAPAHADFSGNITLTLPSTTDTLVGRATFDTLTNKTLTSPTITGTGAIAGTFTGNITGNVTGNVTGNLDGIVGGSTPAAGSFTTLSSSTHFQAAVYADTTARDAAITSPAAGMVAYLTASNKLQVYTGSAWETITSS